MGCTVSTNPQTATTTPPTSLLRVVPANGDADAHPTTVRPPTAQEAAALGPRLFVLTEKTETLSRPRRVSLRSQSSASGECMSASDIIDHVEVDSRRRSLHLMSVSPEGISASVSADADADASDTFSLARRSSGASLPPLTCLLPQGESMSSLHLEGSGVARPTTRDGFFGPSPIIELFSPANQSMAMRSSGGLTHHDLQDALAICPTSIPQCYTPTQSDDGSQTSLTSFESAVVTEVPNLATESGRDANAVERRLRQKGGYNHYRLGGAYLLPPETRYENGRAECEKFGVTFPNAYLMDGQGMMWEHPTVNDGLPCPLNRFELFAASSRQPWPADAVPARQFGNPLQAPPLAQRGGVAACTLDSDTGRRLLPLLEGVEQRIASIKGAMGGGQYKAAYAAALSLLGAIDTFPSCHRLQAVAAAIVSAIGHCHLLEVSAPALMLELEKRGDDGMLPAEVWDGHMRRIRSFDGLRRFFTYRLEYSFLVMRNTVAVMRYGLGAASRQA